MRPAILLLLVLLAGCFLDDMRMRGVPEGETSWRLGYADGCQSGRRDVGGRQKHRELDRDRFRADDQYRIGWQQGYDDCFERAGREASAPMAVEAPPAVVPPVAAIAPSPAAVAPPAAATSPAVAVNPPAVVVTAPVAVAAPPPVPHESSAARRAEIQHRMLELRAELEALQRELENLPT